MCKVNKNDYFKSGGNACLFCHDENIVGGYVQIDSGTAWQTVKCLTCGKKWEDQYKLVDVIVAEAV